MMYGKENKTIKCDACGIENATLKVLDYFVCEKCANHINKAKEINNNGHGEVEKIMVNNGRAKVC